MRCRQAGLTLTECLIALAIAAVIATRGTPALGRLIAESRLVTQANALLTALQLTRAHAWRSNEAWTLCLTDDGARCKPGRNGLARGWLVLPASAVATGLRDTQLNPGLADLRSGLLAEDLALHGTRLGVTFWPLSRGGTTATLTLCSALRGLAPRQIIISQTGRPRLKTVASSAVCPAAR